MYVITGATGHVGSVAAETLLARGKRVRIFAREYFRNLFRISSPVAMWRVVLLSVVR